MTPAVTLACRVALLVALTLGVTAPATLANAPNASPPSIELADGAALSATAVPLRIAWEAAVAQDSPVQAYGLEVRLDGGPWSDVPLASPLARTKTLKVRPWQVVQFRVRATDEDGDTSDWATSQPTWLSAVQERHESLEMSPGWRTVSDSGAFGGAKATSADAVTATYSFTGQHIGWVAQRGPRGSEVEVHIDGDLAGTVDLYRATTAKRRLVFSASWPSVGEHTITLINRATAGRPVATLDAFVVLSEPSTATLVGAGDIARCRVDENGVFHPEESGARLTAAVVESVNGTVYTTGDNVYLYGTPTEYSECYDPTWGAFRGRTRPSPGNHDYGTAGASGYYGYFGDAAGSPGYGFYGYDAGTWRVYALNSECSRSSACGMAQYDWLAGDLAAEPHRCVLAYWHRPVFSSGPHGNSTRMAAIFQLLYDHGAELVLAGHDHDYERFAKARPDGTADPDRGVRQIVVGTGGAALYGFTTTSPLTEVRDNSTHGVLKVNLRPGSYAWEFLPAGNGTFTDTGSTDCH